MILYNTVGLRLMAPGGHIILPQELPRTADFRLGRDYKKKINVVSGCIKFLMLKLESRFDVVPLPLFSQLFQNKIHVR